MTQHTSEAVYFDPYQEAIWKDPYPTFRRLREEAPLYYNKEYDFYAVSRYDDVVAGLRDPETFSSAKGNIMEIIKADVETPRGIFIMEDPPIHTAYRNVVSLLFTPRNINHLEPKIREFCKRCLEPVREGENFDFVRDLGAQMPMRVIGMLLGIPDEDLQSIREVTDARIRADKGKPLDAEMSVSETQAFASYIEWRKNNPSDDIMTQLMNTEFVDETGTKRKLTIDEIQMMVLMMAGAGNETTNRLIGWTGKTLAEHPDQRRDVAADPGLITIMLEEVLRFEPPGAHAARYVARDVEIQGQTVPAGSTIDFILAAANRDESRFENGESFNIHRSRDVSHLTFGKGIHTCIGLSLARLEARVAMEEIFQCFKDWEVDYDNAIFSPTTSVRGWDSLPVFLSR